jgi:hypothetical protein
MAASWSKSNTERWERGFAALSKFRAREGHCYPWRHHVEGGFKLGQWVSVQRYRKHLVPVERKRRLNRIGFVWDWARRSLGTKFCGAFKVRTTDGTLLRADLSQSR